jgi:hypothetical protein
MTVRSEAGAAAGAGASDPKLRLATSPTLYVSTRSPTVIRMVLASPPRYVPVIVLPFFSTSASATAEEAINVANMMALRYIANSPPVELYYQ